MLGKGTLGMYPYPSPQECRDLQSDKAKSRRRGCKVLPPRLWGTTEQHRGPGTKEGSVLTWQWAVGGPMWLWMVSTQKCKCPFDEGGGTPL